MFVFIQHFAFQFADIEKFKKQRSRLDGSLIDEEGERARVSINFKFLLHGLPKRIFQLSSR